MDCLLTQKEVKRLEEKLIRLDEEGIEIVARMRKIVEEDSNVFENSEYQSLKRRLDNEIPTEKSYIQKKLKEAKIVDDSEFAFDGETVSICTKVTLDYEGDTDTFSIMPIYQNEPEKSWVNPDAPIAKLILGKKKGDVVRFRDMNVTILSVERA